MQLTVEQALALAGRVIASTGADGQTTASLAKATVAAEIANHASVGFTHLLDYLDGFVSGRIATSAQPLSSYPTLTTIRVDADAGIGQLGFDLEFERLVTAAERYGVGLFMQCNSYTVGELGYYTRRLAEAGLVAWACSNSPALMATQHSRQPVYGTNPFSFSAPVAQGRPLVIDQASSATAFVNIRAAAASGQAIPAHWALDASGEPTTDARQALQGMLQSFGGERGANIALMVEVLAAGMTGAHWSMDAPSFLSGEQSPGAGLFIAAISPQVLAPDLPQRLSEQMHRLQALGVYMPGSAPERSGIAIAPALFERLHSYGAEPLGTHTGEPA